MPDLAISLIKIVASVILLGGVLWGVSKWTKLAGLPAELARKMVHISLGLYCCTFPWIFDAAWEVVATCALAFLLLVASRSLLKEKLGGGLHAVARKSYGELLFAVSVVLLFLLKDGNFVGQDITQPNVNLGPTLYILPLLILTLSDAASALVGSAYGKRRFTVETGRKSWEGVVAFAITAWLLSMIVYLLFTDIGRTEIILLSFITAVFGALLEAASWKGLDNIFIPMGLFVMLQELAMSGTVFLLMAAIGFSAALALATYLKQFSGRHLHFMIVGGVLLCLIASIGGIEGALTPALAMAAYMVARNYMGEARERHDPLNLMLTIFAISIALFTISYLSGMNTIFAYNLMFAALGVGILARYGAPYWMLGVGLIIGLAAMSWRVIWMESATAGNLTFMGLGFFACITTMSLGLAYRKSPDGHPWLVLGALSFTLAVGALAISPMIGASPQ